MHFKMERKSFNLISYYCLQICQPGDIFEHLSAKVRRNETAMKIITKLWALFKFQWGTSKKADWRCWSCTLSNKSYCQKPSFLQCRPLQLFPARLRALRLSLFGGKRIKRKVSFYYLKFARAQIHDERVWPGDRQLYTVRNLLQNCNKNHDYLFFIW